MGKHLKCEKLSVVTNCDGKYDGKIMTEKSENVANLDTGGKDPTHVHLGALLEV